METFTLLNKYKPVEKHSRFWALYLILFFIEIELSYNDNNSGNNSDNNKIIISGIVVSGIVYILNYF